MRTAQAGGSSDILDLKIAVWAIRLKCDEVVISNDLWCGTFHSVYFIHDCAPQKS